ncbi:MAG: RsmD family RNA methyltransferase, partial [Planctomycetota bacterium]
MRIIAGDHRGRMLKTPPESLATRPYPARVREALFSILRG